MFNTVIDFRAGLIDLLNSKLVEFLGLLVFEFKLTLLPLFLVGHILLPIFNTLGQPLFQEPSVSLEFVYLGPSDLLLDSLLLLCLSSSMLVCLLSLPLCFIIKFLKVIFHVHGLLGLV